MINFSCPRCNTAFEYPDDMAGQKIRCTGPNCNQKLLIPAPAVPATVMGRPSPFAPAAAAAPSAAAPSERLWNYLENGQTQGPVAASELRRLVAAQRLTSKAPVWTEGMGDWRPLQEALPELFRRPADARPRPQAGAVNANADANPNRGGMFEKLGIGVFAIVAAVILVGLFLVLLPLIHTSAAHPVVAATPAAATTADNVKGGADAGKAGPAAGQEMKPQEVTALCKPSVALIRNRGASGSGFLVEGGFVVTNSHVVTGDTVAGLVVSFPSSDLKGEQYKVNLVYEDRKRDLAILRPQGMAALAPLRLCTAKLAEGEDVVAIGSPGIPGIEGGVSTNSADKGTLGNPNFRSSGEDLVYIQHSAKINHGNSGGPLLNMRGEVIGVNVAIIIEGNQGPIDGVKLAIPVDDLREILAKARARKAAEMDHAVATHDAFNLALKLESCLKLYHMAAGYCVDQVFEAGKQNKDLTEAFAAAHADVKAGNVRYSAAKKTLPDPMLYRQETLDPQWDEVNDLLSGSSLDDSVRGKLRQLRDMYLKVKNIYESPSGTYGNMKMELDTMSDDYSKLKESLDAEFGTVF